MRIKIQIQIQIQIQNSHFPPPPPPPPSPLGQPGVQDGTGPRRMEDWEKDFEIFIIICLQGGWVDLPGVDEDLV